MNFVYVCAPPCYSVYRYWEMTGHQGYIIERRDFRRFYSCSLPEAYRKAWSIWSQCILRAFSVEFRSINMEYHIHRELLVGRSMLRYRTATDGDYYVLYAVEGDAPIWSGDDVDEAIARFTLLVQAIEGPRHIMPQDAMWRPRRQNHTMQLIVSREQKNAAKAAESLKKFWTEMERARDRTNELNARVQEISGTLDLENIIGRLANLEARTHDIIDRLDAVSGDAGKEET